MLEQIFYALGGIVLILMLICAIYGLLSFIFYISKKIAINIKIFSVVLLNYSRMNSKEKYVNNALVDSVYYKKTKKIDYIYNELKKTGFKF